MTIVGVFLGKQIRTGGHVRYLELMEGLGARGDKVIVLMNSLLGYEPRSFQMIAHSVPYRRKSFPPASWVFHAEAGRRAGELRAAAGRPDAVLVFGETHLAAGSRVARELGAPLVYGHRSNTVRESLTYLEERGHSPIERFRIRAGLLKSSFDERRIARLSDLLVFQSVYDRDDFLGRNPGAVGCCAVIRGDIMGPRFKPEYALANESSSLRNICFMGTMGPRKGVDYLIEAIIELKHRGLGELRFRICGPGERRGELESRLAAGGASEMAIVTGRVPNPFEEIVAADLLVVPSLFDSYPNTVLEALHAGTPVIGSRVGGIPDMLESEELLFPPMDPGAIADRIERCIREPAFYASLREFCYARRNAFVFDWAEAWESAIKAREARGL